VNELRRRITAAAAARSSTVKRLQSLVANVALAQMLPPAAIKGGTGLKLRLGDAMTRQTPDLDAAFRGDRAAFLTDLAANLRGGWNSFTGTVIEGRPRPPAGVPTAYVMQPYVVKLLFHGRPSWHETWHERTAKRVNHGGRRGPDCNSAGRSGRVTESVTYRCGRPARPGRPRLVP
jgi:hypothetical protein